MYFQLFVRWLRVTDWFLRAGLCSCEEVGPAKLPQLLRQLKGVTTPTPAPDLSPVKTEPMEEEGEVKQLADLGVSGFIEMPIMIKLGPREYT